MASNLKKDEPSKSLQDMKENNDAATYDEPTYTYSSQGDTEIKIAGKIMPNKVDSDDEDDGLTTLK